MPNAEDWTQVRDLVDRYSGAVNDRNEAGIAGVFWTDGEWSVASPFDRHVVGSNAIGAAISESLQGFELLFQMVHSAVIDIKGDDAHVKCVIHEVARAWDGKSGFSMLGHYEDTAVRRHGTWLFQRRRFQPVYLDRSVPLGVVLGQRR